MTECLANKAPSCFEIGNDVEICEPCDTVVVTCAVVLVIVPPDPSHKELSVALSIDQIFAVLPEAVELWDTFAIKARCR